MAEPDSAGERGSAPAEFILVGLLLTALTLAVLQFGLAMYARNIVQDAAVEAAFHAALADTSDAEAEHRAHEVVTAALGHDTIEWALVTRMSMNGVDMVKVDLGATYPLVGFFGISAGSVVTAHAPVESAG
ncbi:MAG: TadE/TadG family type IV pilus assembly protein [Microbacterium gubbeenense]|uniref:TadE/TadG family type IV pilus assembly protein n=1 Tax=Microbacterium gubbeenense TaxID=159896 RepID=UPI0003F86BCD|nr:TadE/TadG family type IV pilus assembly protein [Microbacterium gubbeenense]